MEGGLTEKANDCAYVKLFGVYVVCIGMFMAICIWYTYG
jgi:hypothetical protein